MKSARRRLPLTALRAFEVAARLESFKDAAAELGVSSTTVSNQIRQLERDWNCLLFVRKTRQVVLTEAGQSLSRVVQQAFEAILREIDGRFAETRSAVSIAVGAIFGARWLTPRLNKFRRDLPRIEISVQRGHRFTGPTDMPTPIAVDWGLGDWPGLEARYLLGITYAPVLTPELAASIGGVRSPADLARLPIVHQQERVEWRAWLDAVGASDVKFNEEIIIEDSNIALQAALDGQGVALGIFPFAESEVRAGRLIKPFAEELTPARSYFLLTKPGARRRPEIAAICDWLLHEAHEFRTGQHQPNDGNGRTPALAEPLPASTAYAHAPARAVKARGGKSGSSKTAAPSSIAKPPGKRPSLTKSGKARRRSGSDE
jgi:LysR family transcriptional regulator, glycine cleavage system transcriptional activator